MQRVKIVCALHHGGDFTFEHVERLEAQIARYTPAGSYDFICVDDTDKSNPETAWSGWWCKIRVMRQTGPVLYMDLDTAIVGDLTPLLDAAQQHDFIALKNPYNTPSRFGSGLMAWRGSRAHVYDRFVQDPHHHMRRCTTPQVWGDQGFIAETETPDALWQDLLPGQIVSWKVDCKAGVPKDARVVYFHGTPRPWDVGM